MFTTAQVSNKQQFATYGAQALLGVNPVKKLQTKQVNGSTYYRCLVGAFNTYNDCGIYYPLADHIKRMFDKGGIIHDRLERKCVRGETNHPSLVGLSHLEQLQRLAVIDGQLTQHYILSFELVSGKDEHRKDVVLVYAWLKPNGPFGDQLAKSLNSPEENVAFSVRSFCKTMMYQGRKSKVITDLLTYDGVTEPGISYATTDNAIALEGKLHMTSVVPEVQFTEADFNIAEKGLVGLEHASKTIRMIRDSFGWNKVECTNMISFTDL